MESDLFGTQAASADDIEEVEEELTAAEVLQKLEEAWRNEKHSPEILGIFSWIETTSQPSTFT